MNLWINATNQKKNGASNSSLPGVVKRDSVPKKEPIPKASMKLKSPTQTSTKPGISQKGPAAIKKR